MSTYYSTEAIVFSSINIGEADRLLNLYTKDFGMIKVSAKGLRLQKSKLKGHLSFLSHARVMIIPANGGYRLIDAEVITLPILLSANIYSFVLFLSKLITHEEKDNSLWELLNNVFIKKKFHLNDPKTLLNLKMHTLDALGMMPENGIHNDQDIQKVLSANHML
ncbi:DNA repair protein RecO [Patescibacteria group bacterium]